MKTIAVLGTLDTKGAEHAFVADLIRERGHRALLIDVGTLGEPGVTPDVPRREVLAAGPNGATVESIANADRGHAVTEMSRAAGALLSNLYQSHRIDGVISLGGSGGTSIGTAAMRALPLGVPKVMVSTLASGNTAQYVAEKDIVMIPSIVDVSGINRFSRQVLTRAAGAVCGMVESEPKRDTSEKPLIVASMSGNTAEAVQRAQSILEEAGFEVVVFHATGIGGKTMESVIASGMVAGVLDITTTELADELAGGAFTAGSQRLNAAAELGVPAIVAPGCLDTIDFQARDTVPKRYAGRVLYEPNPQTTLMRTSPDECAALGEMIAEKLNASAGPVTVVLPLKGLSVLGAPGQPFHDREADNALFSALKENLDTRIEVREVDAVINDHWFAEACADALLENLSANVPA